MSNGDDPRTEPSEVPYNYNETVKQGAYGGDMVRAEGMHLNSLRSPRVRMVIDAQIVELERQLAERRSLLKQLDENPATEKLLDTMRRLGV